MTAKTQRRMSSTLASSSKADLRSAALAKRDALSADSRAAAAQAVALRGLPFDVKPGAVVAGYSPIRSELDPAPLMRKLAEQGAQLALPCITARGQSLRFRLWHPGERLLPGPLGILEPSPAAAEIIPDIVLVPLAAFDRAGHRIGYGAGHYDRTLAQLRKRACTAARRTTRLCANGSESVRFPEPISCAFFLSGTWSAGPVALPSRNTCPA